MMDKPRWKTMLASIPLLIVGAWWLSGLYDMVLSAGWYVLIVPGAALFFGWLACGIDYLDGDQP